MNEQEFIRLVKIRLDRVTGDNIDNIANNVIYAIVTIVTNGKAPNRLYLMYII